jgi:hypothetical protein
MDDRTFPCFAGAELTVSRGPQVDGLVFFDLAYRDGGGLTFALDAAAARRMSEAVAEAADEAEAHAPARLSTWAASRRSVAAAVSALGGGL